DWCRSLLILDCQELAAQQPPHLINWCIRLLKMTSHPQSDVFDAKLQRVHQRPLLLSIRVVNGGKIVIDDGAYALRVARKNFSA
ncbi:MAG: hypothetical protein B7X30_08170, partial [Thiomonas sp. 13-64-67]